MKFKYIIPIVLAIGILTFFMVRKTKENETPFEQVIHPPISAKDIPFDSYRFAAESGITIERENGTWINIEPNSLVDSAGNKINGNVTLMVREFHNVDDLFHSGIPMRINTGNREFLQSAGMIEIRAYAANQKLDFATGKGADIELASLRDATGYQLYQLQNDKEWKTTDTFINRRNVRKQKRLEELQAEAEFPKQDIYASFLTNLEAVPQLRPYTNLQWKIPAEEVNKEVYQALRTNWDDVSVQPINKEKSLYKLKFKRVISNANVKDKIDHFTVRAIAMKNGEKISKDDMNLAIKEAENLMEMVKKQADMVNTFKMGKMGIWNIDKMVKQDGWLAKNLYFDFENEFPNDAIAIHIYLLFPKYNTYLEYLPNKNRQIFLPANEPLELRAILPNGQMATLDSIEMNKAVNSGFNELQLKTKRSQ